MLKQYKLRNYHFELIVSIIILNVIGILLIGSAKHSVQKTQIMGMAMGLVAMLVISLMDYSFLLRFTWIYYVGIIGLLIAVKIFGDDAKGATRWIEIAGIRFQPSELAKIVILFYEVSGKNKYGSGSFEFIHVTWDTISFDFETAGYVNFNCCCINFC